jgi:hypothetical protein
MSADGSPPLPPAPPGRIQRSSSHPTLQPLLGREGSDGARSVVRRLSRMISLTTLRKEFECQICLDNCMRRNRVVLGDCPAGDAHAMCTPCATTYLTGRVEEGRVLQGLRCPNHGQDGCAARASPDQLKRLLSDETFAKYERFLAQREDPTMRECPVCAERVRPKRKRSDGADPGASAGGGPPPAAGEIGAALRCSRGPTPTRTPVTRRAKNTRSGWRGRRARPPRRSET